MAPRLETVPHQPDPLQVLALASRRTTGLAMLHSAAVHPSWGRWSILCAEPVDVIEVADTSGLDPFAHLAGEMCAGPPSESGDVTGNTSTDRVPWSCGRGSQAADQGHTRPDADLPFWAGWVGYMGYEAGRFLETLPTRTLQDIRLPMARFGLYGSAALYDHLTRRWFVTAADLPDHPNAPLTGDDGLRFWTGLLRDAERETLPASATAPAPLASIAKVDEYLAGMQSSLSPTQFKAAVARAVDYIAAGDIYQVNLARRLTTALPAEPLDLYLRLCRANPAWYAAYLAFDDKAVLSSSPELFLQVRGDHVITRPIKGTSPRVHQDDLDARARRDLLASEKDHAELTMIIDLMRNDLGRVCRFGTVRVLEPFGLEEHPTVYHLVGTIEGRLLPGRNAIDLLRATFPGGSITGAPKIRAMQIIDELEPVARSVYCGGIGCISLDGRMTMNIAIRTLLVDGPRVHLYAGGGIVADSRPDLELHETTAKARGMARALASFL